MAKSERKNICSPAGTVAAVSNSEESAVIVYDVAKGTVLRRLDGFVTPRNIVFAPDGARFYVSDSGTGRITVYETATGKEAGVLAAGPGAFGTVLSADGTAVNLRDTDDEAFRAAEELGINISTRFESSSIDEI